MGKINSVHFIFLIPFSGKIAKWPLFSWNLWKKQSRPSLSFITMTLEKTTTSEFPSQNLQSDFSVNFSPKTGP